MITVGSRVRWILPFIYVQNSGTPLGYEGTVVALSPPEDRNRWAWVKYDDGTEQDAYVCHLKEIADDVGTDDEDVIVKNAADLVI